MTSIQSITYDKTLTMSNKQISSVMNNRIIKRLPFSLLGCNPIKVLVSILSNSNATTWKFSPISYIFEFFFSIINYFVIIPYILLILFSKPTMIKYKHFSNNYLSFLIFSVLISLFVFIFYTIKMGSVQERIRITVYPLLLISIIIYNKYNKTTKAFKMTTLFIILPIAIIHFILKPI